MSDSDSNPLENYSPFEQSAPIPIKTTTESPSYIPPSRANKEMDEDEEIREYERKLSILESQLDQQEIMLQNFQETGEIEPPKNWPKFYPVVHFDIDEVQPVNRTYVNQAMYSWCIMVVAFTLNWVACLSLLGSGGAVESPGSKIALASLYLYLVVPLALDLDALSVYRVMQKEKVSYPSLIKVFVFIGITIIFEFFQALGGESSGSCGLITTLNLLTSAHWFIGALSLIVTLCFAYSLLLEVRLITGLWNYYKGTDVFDDMKKNIKEDAASKVISLMAPDLTN